MRKQVFQALALAGLFCAAAPAYGAVDPYDGKIINIFAGRPPGGGVDSEMRLVAQYLADHIPSHPRIVPRNMPGAGGVVLGNYLYNVAPKDGLTIGVPGRTSFLLSPVEGNPNVRYDLAKFTWIGSPASSNFILWMRKGSGITTLAELRASKTTLTIGGSGNGNSDTVIPEILAKYEKLPIKVVRGYPGTADEVLALQRGEIDGMFTEQASFGSDPEAAGIAVPILQTFPLRKGLPTTQEVASDPVEKSLLGLFAVSLHVGLAMVAPPDLDPAQVKVLRDAYRATVSDPHYIADATKRGFAVGSPNDGAEIAQYLQQNLSGVPENVRAEFVKLTQ